MRPASKFKRFIAFIIDLLFAAGVMMIPYVGIVFSVLYLLLRDGLQVRGLRKRSIGKSVMGLAIVDMDSGEPVVSALASVKRNFLLVVPFLILLEGCFVLFDREGRRIGDRFAATRVVADAPPAI